MPTFWDLPRELRDLVYEQYILDVIDEQQGQARRPLTTVMPLLVSNKQVGREAAQVSMRCLAKECADTYTGSRSCLAFADPSSRTEISSTAAYC